MVKIMILKDIFMQLIYTIGHSNSSPETFTRLLEMAKVEFLVDIRSNPNSGWVSFANSQNLKETLTAKGITYIYMGDTLGGHPSDPDCYDPQTGKVDYRIIRQKETFKRSISRLVIGSKKYRICLMCAEESPVHCHRSLLVGDALSQEGVQILHIRGDDRIQTDEELLKERAGVIASQYILPL
jgi:uncharacterized protein (DUF488 family)